MNGGGRRGVCGEAAGGSHGLDRGRSIDDWIRGKMAWNGTVDCLAGTTLLSSQIAATKHKYHNLTASDSAALTHYYITPHPHLLSGLLTLPHNSHPP